MPSATAKSVAAKVAKRVDAAPVAVAYWENFAGKVAAIRRGHAGLVMISGTTTVLRSRIVFTRLGIHFRTSTVVTC